MMGLLQRKWWLRHLAFDKFNTATCKNADIVIRFAVAAILPIFLVLAVAFLSASILENLLIDKLPARSEVLVNLFINPWLETLIFFAPLRWMNSTNRGLRRTLPLVIAAAFFAPAHLLVGDRSSWAIIFLFWAGIVMAHAYDFSYRAKRPAILLVSAIHFFYNAFFYIVIASSYAIAHWITSPEIRVFITGCFYLFLFVVLWWCYVKTIARSQWATNPVNGDA